MITLSLQTVSLLLSKLPLSLTPKPFRCRCTMLDVAKCLERCSWHHQP